MGLGVTYGIGDAGEDFTNQQFGVSIESELNTDNPVGVFFVLQGKGYSSIFAKRGSAHSVETRKCKNIIL